LGNFAAPHQANLSQYEIRFHGFFCFQHLKQARSRPQRPNAHSNEPFAFREKKQHFPLKKSFLPLENGIFPFSIRVAASVHACSQSINF
jgi:hypothetical protein